MIVSVTKCTSKRQKKKRRKVNLNETELFGSSLGRAEETRVRIRDEISIKLRSLNFVVNKLVAESGAYSPRLVMNRVGSKLRPPMPLLSPAV